MLRPRSEAIAAYIGPETLCVLRERGGLKPVTSGRFAVSLPADASPTQAVDTFGEILRADGARSATLRIVVHDTWVRFGVLPPAGMRVKAEERRAQAEYLLADLYGDMQNWKTVCSQNPPGKTTLVSAIGTAILDRLEVLAREFDLRLESVEPHLSAAFNYWKHKLPGKDAWFVSIDSQSISAARLGENGLDNVYSHRWEGSFVSELQRLKVRDITSSADAHGHPIYVQLLTNKNFDKPRQLNIRMLSEENPGSSLVTRLMAYRSAA